MTRNMGCLVAAVWAVGCGGSSSSPKGAATTTATDFAGVYSATYSGTYVVTSPPGQPGGNSTSSATMTITDLASNEIQVDWQVPPNPPSGRADFDLTGDTGTTTGTGGMCFTGKLANGDTQTNCCTMCSITFTSADTFVQPNAGTFTGTTALGVAYSGTYSGTWTGAKP
jgi:hypothetical protein